MITALANPQRFMALSRWLAPVLGAAAVALGSVGLGMGLNAPPDYQQGATVLIMFCLLYTSCRFSRSQP